MTDVFHSGEVAVQERSGQRSEAILNARVIEPRIPERAIPFLAQQFWCIAAFQDNEGEIQAQAFGAAPGFATTAKGTHDDGQILTLDIGLPLQATDYIGLIFIDLARRRRLRVNGQVISAGDEKTLITVREGYPNCPKFITQRDISRIENDDRPSRSGIGLTLGLLDWIEKADTAFVASRHPESGMDLSHRGGAPGFIGVQAGQLIIPDYAGNAMFNTLGNLMADPRAGLMIPDFDRGLQLQLTGRAEVHFEPLNDDSQRYWTFQPDHWQIRSLGVSS